MDIEFKGIEHVDEFLKKVAPEVIEIAQRNAINRTLSKVKSRSAKGVSKASGIKPVKLIRKRFKLQRSNKKFKNGAVVFYHISIPVEQLAGRSGVQWNRKMAGALVNGKTYVGSFGVAPTKGRYAGKFKRVYERVSSTGDNKKDLQVVRKPIEKYGPVLLKVGQRVVNQDLVNNFHKQMAWLLKKHGYTSGSR